MEGEACKGHRAVSNPMTTGTTHRPQLEVALAWDARKGQMRSVDCACGVRPVNRALACPAGVSPTRAWLWLALTPDLTGLERAARSPTYNALAGWCSGRSTNKRQMLIRSLPFDTICTRTPWDEQLASHQDFGESLSDRTCSLSSIGWLLAALYLDRSRYDGESIASRALHHCMHGLVIISPRPGQGQQARYTTRSPAFFARNDEWARLETGTPHLYGCTHPEPAASSVSPFSRVESWRLMRRL